MFVPPTVCIEAIPSQCYIWMWGFGEVIKFRS